jgi:hypothetical protein
MKTVLALTLFYLSLSYSFSQETIGENIISKENVLTKGCILKIPISDKLSLQKGLIFSNYGAFNQLEIPILFKHNIAQKWSLLYGTQLSTITNYQSNLLEIRENGFKNFDVSIYLGTEYQISEKTLGKLSLKYTILRKVNTSFQTIDIDNNPLKFNLGVKF